MPLKTGSTIPNPFMRFEDEEFPDYVVNESHEAGFAAPNYIQSKVFAVDWAGHGWDCTDWIWEEGLLASLYHTLQQPALSR